MAIWGLFVENSKNFRLPLGGYIQDLLRNVTLAQVIRQSQVTRLDMLPPCKNVYYKRL